MTQSYEDRYRVLVENLPGGFARHRIVTDDAGNPVDYIFLEVNRAFEKLTGLKKENIIGKTLTEVLPGIEHASFDWVDAYGRVALSGENVHFEQYSELLGRYYEVFAYAEDDDCFAVIFFDITDRIEKQERTKELNCLHNFSLLLIKEENDLEGILKETVRLLPPVFRYPEDICACINLRDYRFVNRPCEPDSYPKITANLKLQDEQVGSIEVCYTGQFSQKWEPFLKEERLVIETIAEHLSRVVEQIESREELKKSEERLDTILDNTPAVIYSYQPVEGKPLIGYVNDNAAAVLGYTPKEITGDPDLWAGSIHPEDIDVFAEAVDKLQKRKKSIVIEYRFKHKEGRYIWLLEQQQFIAGEGGGNEVVAVCWDITKRKQAEEQVRYLSFHDSLTGLYNRAFLEEELKRADSERQLPISIIMADLNGLKLVNDTYGHSTGDRMLIRSAQILKKSCRREDVIARWGGDEFVILLPKTNRQAAEAVCQRINEMCRGAYVGDVPLSLSLGLATRENTDTDLPGVLHEAEDNMYKQKLAESRSTRSGVLNALLKTLGSKSNETEEHTRRMKEVALKIGEQLGLPDSELNRLNLLITLHDIGKINIPDEILNKEAPLTDEEWEIMKKHPEIGFRIARATEDFAHVADDILAHHERWDGGGYPQGLKGEEIPLLARIVAIADVYEVAAYGRNYCDSLSPEEIIEEFKKEAGSQFDPKLVEIFLSII